MAGKTLSPPTHDKIINIPSSSIHFENKRNYRFQYAYTVHRETNKFYVTYNSITKSIKQYITYTYTYNILHT